MPHGYLIDEHWQRLEPLLPPQKQWTGKPNLPYRPVVNGILLINRTGAPWRDLPPDYGQWETVASRFYRWRQAGVWEQVLETLQAAADADGDLDWQTHYVDSTVIRAHQHAAGARGKDSEAEGFGRSRSGFTTKIHLRVEGQGKPIAFLLTPGQAHDAPSFKPLMERGKIERYRGKRKYRPGRIVADKAHGSKAIWAYLRAVGIRSTIPWKSNQQKRGPFDKAIYRERNRVERAINRLKQFRRVATRYEKRAVNT
jgi:transposase